MNATQTILKDSFTANKLFIESPMLSSWLWENLIIEKRISMNWIVKIYKGSFLYDFWLLATSPIN